ncbi:DUF393 domain-containing protein [Thalassotalea euphylliae]|uniref:DUF393 domain-containing protein n=1 Tax=Thalassotalea euphylliae TaxID=1655234 RepID=A0A3E0TN39_9GAMM|nr:DUF393 domain-containing protein [Thalassotalea euphylliae]REL25823.1 DUF393 domain-containing protein [Thalassotalea euphylliae]
MATLILFYDGNCPLCLREINALAKRDTQGNIQFEDLHQSDFGNRFPDINRFHALQIIHAKLGAEVITGVDVIYHAWRLVGKERWVRPLTWPLINPLAKLGYRIFAKYRHPISRLYAKLTQQSEQCNSCTRETKSDAHLTESDSKHR